MKRIVITLFLAALLSHALPAQTPASPKLLITHIYDSVALLYIQDSSGDMRMACTATAFSATPKGYRFVSAAHCVVGDDDKQQQLQKFYISADTKGTKAYFPAKLVQAGDKALGDDFSLFEVDTADHFDTINLGDEDKLKLGDLVNNIGGALGMGKQFFVGYVSELHIDRPPVDAGEVHWTDLMLIQVGGGPGSSGSAIVSVDQNAIVGFLVGTAQSDVGKLCVPVSKFKAFLTLVDAGNYKKSKKPTETSNLTGEQRLSRAY